MRYVPGALDLELLLAWVCEHHQYCAQHNLLRSSVVAATLTRCFVKVIILQLFGSDGCHADDLLFPADVSAKLHRAYQGSFG